MGVIKKWYVIYVKFFHDKIWTDMKKVDHLLEIFFKRFKSFWKMYLGVWQTLKVHLHGYLLKVFPIIWALKQAHVYYVRVYCNCVKMIKSILTICAFGSHTFDYLEKPCCTICFLFLFNHSHLEVIHSGCFEAFILKISKHQQLLWINCSPPEAVHSGQSEAICTIPKLFALFWSC